MSLMPSWSHNPSPHPPGCDCGCRDDCGPPWSAEAIQCWSEMQKFKQMLKEVIADMGPLPLRGAVDGKPAQPGMVGEFISQTTTVPVAAGNNLYNVSSIIMPPGDWDIQAQAVFHFALQGAWFVLSPVPPGISDPANQMQGWSVTGQIGDPEVSYGLQVLSARTQGLFTVPTLLPFAVTVSQASAAGNFDFLVTARRMR